MIAVKEDKAKAQTMKSKAQKMKSIAIDTRHYSEDDLEADHWDMIKARVFATLFIIWVCFAVWDHYVS